MTSRSVVCALTALALCAGTAAQAQSWRHGDYRGEAQTPRQHQWQGQWQGQRQWQAPAYTHRNYAPQYGYAPRYYGAPQYHARGYAPRYWAGGYVPYPYRAHRYWVNDWRARHLAPPPYGYQWVETDTGDVLLIALATGLIASAILAQ
jgi:Ni/Co efflux regulator RcnB